MVLSFMGRKYARRYLALLRIVADRYSRGMAWGALQQQPPTPEGMAGDR